MFTKKDLSKLIIPLVIEQFLAVFVGMMGVVMVASAGEAAVSGVSLADTINILIITIFSALATGGAVISAQYIGRGDKKNACISANQLLLSGLIISTAITALCVAGHSWILSTLFGNIDAEVMSGAKTYFLITAFSFPFLSMYNSCAALFRSMGNSKVSMKASLCMNAINIIGNSILIYGFHMGTAGVAIPALVSRIAAAVIMLVMIRNPKLAIHIGKEFGWRPDYLMIKRILSIGIPNGLENGMFQIGKILVLRIISLFGTTAITANAVSNTIASFAVLPGSAIGLALITIVGQCAGAKEFEQAKRYTLQMMKITYTAMAVVNIAIIFSCPWLVRLFNLSDATAAVTIKILVYHSICAILIWPLSFTLPNALRAASDVKFTMIISIVSMWTWRIAFCYVLGKVFGLGVFGAWVAMTIDWAFRALCFIYRFFSGKWQRIRL
ncbi:MATE family efflux transporter [Anaerobium acetethylicum]|uniref:Probable multidrug resistance protein NorM n=1 Tax=Anaerobium acetethylicum TaxID=1619234 RepID=A0A1D3TQA6_9FIRM|nr:MATE family efflux transporter [Anaerobium acetethylicum]SCP95664.1 putative efflux protein, MATE family [Anaerobium acetethylicum]